MDSTRKISFIEDDESIDAAVDLAIASTDEENMLRFCDVLSAQLAMQGIDLKTHPVKRKIYFINE